MVMIWAVCEFFFKKILFFLNKRINESWMDTLSRNLEKLEIFQLVFGDAWPVLNPENPDLWKTLNLWKPTKEI